MDIERICNVIDAGGLVITPTDTIYGIMADALNETVIKKVYEVKKRSFDKPLIVLMNSFEMVEQYIEELSKIERKIIKRFWPGLVTIIFKKNDRLSNLLTGGNDTIAIRIPDNKDLLKIISKLNRPVISTSANITGTEVITSIEMLEKDLIDKIDYIEDGGILNNESSTIIRIDNGNLIIVREGKIADEIRNYFEVSK